MARKIMAIILVAACPGIFQGKSTLTPVPAYEHVNFCELVRNPETYDGKIVIVSALLGNNPEMALLSDDGCKASSADGGIVWTINESTYEVGSPLDKKLNKLMRLNPREMLPKGKWAHVTIVALFTDGKYPIFGHLNCCRYKLEVQQLLAVQKVKLTKRG